MSVQTTDGCCTSYECVCNTDLCDNTVPECPEYYEAVIFSNNDCCPVYDCMCDPNKCPKVYCEDDQHKVMVKDDLCCPTYE